MMNEESKNYVMTEEEFNVVCKNIAKRWTVTRREDVEKELNYDVIDKQGYEEFWNWYEKSTEDDVRDWIDDPDDCGGHNVFFDVEELEDGEEYYNADALEEDTLDSMWSDTNHYDDSLDMEEELKPYIRKINSLSEEEIKNAEWTVRDNRTDGNYPDGSQCVYKLFEATICGHKYGVEYSEEYGYVMYVDGREVGSMEDTTEEDSLAVSIRGGEWNRWDLASYLGEIIGESLDALDPELEEMARQAEKERFAED
jgi:hypothetical protein